MHQGRPKPIDLPLTLELVAKLSAGVVSVSFIFGTAMLLGRCLGIGLPALGYITVADAINSALIVSPLALGEIALGLMYFVATMRPGTGESRFFWRLMDRVEREPFYCSRSAMLLVVACAFASIFFLPKILAAAATFIAVLALICIVFLRIGSRIDRGIVSLPMGGAVACFSFFFMIAAASFSITSNYEAELIAKKPVNLVVELCADACEKVYLIAHFAEVTVVLSATDGRMSYVGNSEIKRITETTIRSNDPIVDPVAVLRSAFKGMRSFVSNGDKPTSQ